jgi:hypothetical protein
MRRCITLGVVLFFPAIHSPGQTALPYDFSQQHVVFPAADSAERQAAIEQDVRFHLQRLRRTVQQFEVESPRSQFTSQADAISTSPGRSSPGSPLQVGWQEAVGDTSDTVKSPTFPAKYSSNVANPVPDCAHDYVVYTLPNAGAGKFNVIAYNNLYVNGTASGVCHGTTPEVLFAYNASQNDGKLATAPALSLDGTQIAFIENSSSAQLHILKWHAGDKSATFPKPFNSSAMANCATNQAVAPCEYSVTYSTTTATLSTPYVDYGSDTAYVSDDAGHVSAIHPIFSATPANPPAVVTGYPLTPGAGVMTGPVFDSVSGNVFVADPTRLYYIRTPASATGTCVSGSRLPCVGRGSQTTSVGAGAGSTLESPIVDSTNGWVFAFAWSGAPYKGATIVQSNTTLSVLNVAEISGDGGSTSTNLFAGTFDNNYFNNPATGKLYACGENGAGHFGTLWAAGFTSAGMKTGKAGFGPLNLTTASVAGGDPVCSSLGEFYNQTAGKDYLFAGVAADCAFGGASTGCVFSFDITNSFPTAVLGNYSSPGGSSGIIADNVTGSSTSAASIYYLSTQPPGSNAPCTVSTGGTNTDGNCAVKLVQSGQ